MGVAIIDKTKPKSPILEYIPKPTFRTTYERDKYWAEEKVKWVEGVGEIPGTLIHKTQEQKIKDRDLGHIFRPICRDVDLLIHQTVAECRKAGEALVIIKGRGVGLSAEMGCMANYFMKVYPGTSTLLTSQEKAKIASLFSEKVALTYDQYDEEIKPVQVNRNETSNTCYLKVEQYYKNPEGETQLNTSQITCRETSDTPASASAFSGQGAIFGAYDELFLHKRRKELVRSSASCFMNAKTRKTTGFLLAGGTCEDTLTNEQLAELSKLVKEIQTKGYLETMKAKLLFIPAWMGTFMTNGWSDEKKGREWWEKEVEALEKLDDGSAVRAFRMNNPMSLDDIFELDKGGRFEDDVADKIKEQHKIITLDKPPIQVCNLVDMGHEIVKQYSKKGKVEILEDPRDNVGYYLNIDGVATGTKAGADEGSNVAGTIVKMFDTNGLIYAPVSIYTERPETIEQSYINLCSQARYYNKFGGLKGIMAEANAGTADHFSTFLEKNGLGKFIMNRQDLSGKGNSNKKKLFQYVTVDVRDFQIKASNIFLRKYISNIRMLSLLNQMMTAKSENADILDSWYMWFIAAKDYDKPAKTPPPPAVRQVQRMERDKDGRTITVWSTK